MEGWVAGLALGGRRNLTPIFSRRLLTGVLESRRQDGGATKERLNSKSTAEGFATSVVSSTGASPSPTEAMLLQGEGREWYHRRVGIQVIKKRQRVGAFSIPATNC